MLALALLLAEPPMAVGFTTECSNIAYHALDFWLGDWDILAADGRLVARSRIEKDADGCVLRETFTTPDGKRSPLRGPSTTMREGRDGLWEQSFTDAKGRIAMLVGNVGNDEAAFVQMFGRERTRFRLTRQPDGSLRQQIETSGDFGKTFVAASAPVLIWRRRPTPWKSRRLSPM